MKSKIHLLLPFLALVSQHATAAQDQWLLLRNPLKAECNVTGSFNPFNAHYDSATLFHRNNMENKWQLFNQCKASRAQALSGKRTSLYFNVNSGEFVPEFGYYSFSGKPPAFLISKGPGKWFRLDDASKIECNTEGIHSPFNVHFKGETLFHLDNIDNNELLLERCNASKLQAVTADEKINLFINSETGEILTEHAGFAQFLPAYKN